MTIKIEGDCHGQLATGDIHNHAPVLTIHMGEQTPESRRQAEFAKDTGIYCNRPSRETLLWLMEHHGFTGKELAGAWKADALMWSEVDRCVKADRHWSLYNFMGWSMFWLSLTLFCFALFGVFVQRFSPPHIYVNYLLGAPAFLFSMWVSARFFIYPYRTAQRVKRVLAN